VLDGGHTSDGRRWLAMELVDGPQLDAFVEQHAAELGTAGVVRLIMRVCEAIAAAHRRGVIHRDLKPANILVESMDGEPRPRVLDFGLARHLDDASGNADDADGASIAVTREGAPMGALAYASPEQIAGEIESIDTRTDVYSIGVLLHEALTGGRPFDCSGSWLTVAERIRNTEPTPLRRMPNPRVPVDRDLEMIVRMAISREPVRRYESVAALRADLERWARGDAVEARRESRWYLAAKFLSRHRRAAITGALALAALLAFGAAMSVLYRRAIAEAEKLARVNVFLEDTLGSVEPESEHRPLTLRRTLDEGAVWIDLAFRGDPASEAAIRHILGVGYRNLGALDEAQSHLERALELLREITGERSEPVARAVTALALLRRDQGRYDDALSLLERAEAIRVELHGADSPALDGTKTCEALVRAASGDPTSAARIFESLLERRRRRLGADHPDVAMTQFQLAVVQALMGDREQALQLHEAALATRSKTLDPAHPDLARSRLAVAELLVAQGAKERARALLEASLASFGERFGRDSPLARRTAQLLAECVPARPSP